MVAFAEDRSGWAVARGRHLVARVGQLELLDRAYTLAAQSFVAIFPLILAVAAGVTTPGSNVVAEEVIRRFGLAGAAAQAVQDLIVVRAEGYYWLGLILTLLRRVHAVQAGVAGVQRGLGDPADPGAGAMACAGLDRDPAADDRARH